MNGRRRRCGGLTELDSAEIRLRAPRGASAGADVNLVGTVASLDPAGHERRTACTAPGMRAAVLAMALVGGCAMAHERTCEVSTFDEFAARYPSAVCGFDSPQVERTLFAELGYWPLDCQRELGEAMEQRHFAHVRAAIARGVVTFDADQASRCLCALGSGRRQLQLPYACGFVTVGGAIGSACAVADDCAPGMNCRHDGGACGTCAATSRGVGTPCTLYHPCAGADYPLFCDDPDFDGNGVCHPQADLGAPCVRFGCVPGGVCDPDARCIEDRPPTSDVGGACDDGHAVCAPGLVCVADGARHACALPLTDGTCRRAHFDTSDCVPGYECDATSDDARGACVPLMHASESCPGWCPHGTRCGVFSACEAPLDLGAPCVDERQCLSGVCVDGVCAIVPLCP